MLKFTTGNIFDSSCQALVNPVNCVGVMGKGLALEFKRRYPMAFTDYEICCNAKSVKPGTVFVSSSCMKEDRRLIIHFATKQHWRHPSRLEWVIDGLTDLKRAINAFKIKSIAIPALGCGCGGLEWADVLPEIERALGDLEGCEVLVYPPRC